MEISETRGNDAQARKEQPPFQTGEGKTAYGTEPQSSIGKNRKILIVDDNPIVVRAFQMKLKASGFEVITATEGSEGVGAARRAKPDLIILDLNFPSVASFSSLNWDGFSIMQWLKRFKEVADIPIIILTSEDPAAQGEPALAAGAAAFCQKPVDFQEFLALILKHLRENPL